MEKRSICVVLLIFAIGIVLYGIQEVKEKFEDCFVMRERIRSIDVEIALNENLYIYEFSISKFRELVRANNLKRNHFVRDLNNLAEVKRTGGGTFENIRQIDNEAIVYRVGKYYGFHVRFNGNNTVDVLGVVNDYDILNKHTTREEQTLEDIVRMHMADPMLSSYSGMSSSSAS